jgi:hypothetical protein
MVIRVCPSDPGPEMVETFRGKTPSMEFHFGTPRMGIGHCADVDDDPACEQGVQDAFDTAAFVRRSRLGCQEMI